MIDERVIPRDVTGINFERQFGDKKEKEININPEENEYIRFKKGFLVVYCSHELDVKDKIRLYLNMGLEDGDLYYINQKGLKKIIDADSPLVYHKYDGADYCIKARESLWGELELKIKKEGAGTKVKFKVVFSRKEYNTIIKYMDALNNLS